MCYNHLFSDYITTDNSFCSGLLGDVTKVQWAYCGVLLDCYMEMLLIWQLLECARVLHVISSLCDLGMVFDCVMQCSSTASVSRLC